MNFVQKQMFVRWMSALVALTFLNSAMAQDGPPPAAVEVSKVIEKNIAPNIWVPGTIISREDSNVASEVSGVLTMVAEVGDIVEKGQTLAQVNARQLKLRLERDRAELARLESRLKFAQRQLERTISLAETSGTAQFRIDELEMERDVLEQEIVLARVERDQTAYLLDRSKIVAPFSGIVVARHHQPGEHIAVGEELLRLVNTKTLEISAQAPVEVGNFVKAGDLVQVKSKDKQVDTKLRSVIPVGDPRSRMLEVRIELQSGWVIGDAVEVALTNGPGQQATIIPRDALVLRNDSVFVYRVNEKGEAEKVDVEPGVGDHSNIAVNGLLNIGDSVVTRGAERLKDGQQVKVLEEVANR